MRVKFIEEGHRYLTEDNRMLTSVSSFVEKFKEKTDWRKIASAYSVKQKKLGINITTDEVLEKWERKKNLSAEAGTLLHSIKENELLESLNPLFYDKSCKTQSCEFIEGSKYSIPINKLEDNTVYPELMIYDFDHMICGQSDKVIVTNKKINIWDYKTDAEIKFKAFENQWVKAKKLLPPLSHLDECNANIYSLKMSMYMYFLWKANKGFLKPGEIIIEHITLERDPENDNIPVLKNGIPVIIGKPKIIKLPYRKKEVEDMLKTLK